MQGTTQLRLLLGCPEPPNVLIWSSRLAALELLLMLHGLQFCRLIRPGASKLCTSPRSVVGSNSPPAFAATCWVPWCMACRHHRAHHGHPLQLQLCAALRLLQARQFVILLCELPLAKSQLQNVARQQGANPASLTALGRASAEAKRFFSMATCRACIHTAGASAARPAIILLTVRRQSKHQAYPRGLDLPLGSSENLKILKLEWG